MLIAINLNIHKNIEEVAQSIKDLFDNKNVANFYFPRRHHNFHSDIVNVECQFSTMCKQYVKKMIKLHNKYVKFIPHPHSMDGVNVPNKTTLRNLGFLNVNTTVANMVHAIQNIQGSIASTNKKYVSHKVITTIVKEAINEEQQQLKFKITRELRSMREETLTEARAYTYSTIENLSNHISLQFEELISNIKTIQKLLKDPSQHLALPSSSQEKLN